LLWQTLKQHKKGRFIVSKLLSFLDLAEIVLKEKGVELGCTEIWDVIEEKYRNQLNTTGKTPAATLFTRMYETTSNTNSLFYVNNTVKPKKYGLKVWKQQSNQTNTSNASLFQPKKKVVGDKSTYDEIDIHPFVSYYAKNYLNLYTKTIDHKKSNKSTKGSNEWQHPDMVGVYFPFLEWEKGISKLSEIMGSSKIKIVSFELKKELNFGNLRESYFQAVSNSSWANEGYLVASKISKNIDFQSELKRLSTLHGVGIIQINLEEPDLTEILFAATQRNEIDWETANKLCKDNRDFRDFVDRVSNDFSISEPRYEHYDKIFPIEELKNKYNSF
jgi:hypothetical protein